MWRGVSVRKLGLLLAGPMLVETTSMLFLMWMLLQAVAMGYAPREQMLIATIGSLAYCASSYLAGRWIGPRAAPWLMVLSILGVLGLGLAALAGNSFWLFLALAPLMGLCMGHYYVPFQINMSHVRPFRTLAWSVAFYNISWSLGASIGPFLGAWLRQAPVATIGAIGLVLVVVHTLLNVVAHTAPPPRHEEAAAAAFASTPRQRLHVWVCFIAGNVVVLGVYATLWPYLSDARGFSDPQKGVGLFCTLIPVAAAAPFWARLRRIGRQPWLLLGSMAVGAGGFIALPLVTGFGPSIACLLAIGVMKSSSLFYAIYYANADPSPTSRGRSVAMTEVLAGAGLVLGPLCLGLLAWDDALSPRPYAFGTLVVAAAILWVAWSNRFQSEKRPPVSTATGPRAK